LSSHHLYAKVVIGEGKQDVIITPINSIYNAKASAFSNDRYWIKIEVNKKNNGSYILECLSPHLKDIEVVITSKNGRDCVYRSGADYLFNHRSLRHKNFIFPLPEEKGDYSIWIGLSHHQPHDLSFKLREYDVFVEYAVVEYFLLGFYYGILCIVFLYNLFLFIKGKILLHALYALYIVGCIILSLQEDGLSYHFLWSQSPLANTIIVQYISQPIFVITFIVYAIGFLNIKSYYNEIENNLLEMLFIYLCSVVISFFLPFYIVVSDWIFFGILFLVYICSFLIARKGNYFANYFLAGFSIIVVSILIKNFRVMGVLPSNILTVYIFNFGIILEVIIFSIALADRVGHLQKEKKKHQERLLIEFNKNDKLQKQLINELEEKKELQAKVNLELEEGVRKRTEELEEANQKISSFAKEMDRLNSELDKYNYSLKREIKEEKLLRIYHNEITYNEFLQIYPDDDACLKEIQMIKWPDTFACIKCGHTKACNSMVWYRRKCTRCDHIESVTSHTLFHHLKFPLTKAFYISYIEFGKIEYSDEKLSTIIDLNKPTVKAFRKKVSNRTRDKKYEKIINWKEMILD
jgi:hypothetical protein